MLSLQTPELVPLLVKELVSQNSLDGNTLNVLNVVLLSTVVFFNCTHWQVTPALICVVAESSGTLSHLGLHGINAVGCSRR